MARGSDAYRLWIAMWSRADDDGVFRGDPRRLFRVVIGRPDSHDIAAVLAELERARLVAACPRRRWRGIQLLGAHAVCAPPSGTSEASTKGE